MKIKLIFIVAMILFILLSLLSHINNQRQPFTSYNIKYTAIIIEPREHQALEFVLKNFIFNLSDEWQFLIFHGNNNKQYIENILNAHFQNEITRIQLIDLQVDNLSIQEYNKLLFSKEFYNTIPTELFLLFQTDTMLFTENVNKINDYFQYDYVGAPWVEKEWNKNTDKIGNGGLSIRRKSKMLEVLDKCEISENVPEDVYFSTLFCDKVKLNKPSIEKSKEFSVEQVYSENPIGAHKPWIYGSYDKLSEKYTDLQILRSLN